MADPGEERIHDQRAARVLEVLERRKLAGNASAAQASQSWENERFVSRARALFYARLMFLTLGLLMLAVPEWQRYFGLAGPIAVGAYLTMLMYSVANFMVIRHPVAGRWVTYITLCLDLLIMVFLIVKPQVGGGLQSPLLATQLLFTTLFAILFPKPLAILPPLLTLPVTTRLDLLLNRTVTAVDVLTLLWYSALNFIIVYVIVYLNEAEAAGHREVVNLQADLRELAVVEERNRLAREIHDGLGASLSSLIIQSEYLMQFASDDKLRAELGELKQNAEESMDELRRSLRMMREDFDLAAGMADYVRTFGERTQLPVTFEVRGAPGKTSADAQLVLFRVAQEALSNAAKHAAAGKVGVTLAFQTGTVLLSVADDGRGFDPRVKPRDHYGLLNMNERAQKIGGTLIIDSEPGKGTRISLSVSA